MISSFSDSVKNQLAMEVITRIVSDCRWLNVHIVHPHDAVFEIRLPEGYGARWSVDGTKVLPLFHGVLSNHYVYDQIVQNLTKLYINYKGNAIYNPKTCI